MGDRFSFEQTYRQGGAPWDIGKPQGAVLCLAEMGAVKGTVLDVGCGTGDNALFLASRGHDVTGIDAAPSAIERATQKAARSAAPATFLIHDALALDRLDVSFDTVIDSGLFHTFSDEQRPVFVRQLATVLKPGGRYLMLCFSEHETRDGGPRRVTQAEIRQAFSHGWDVEDIWEARFDDRIHEGGARAWLSSIRKA